MRPGYKTPSLSTWKPKLSGTSATSTSNKNQTIKTTESKPLQQKTIQQTENIKPNVNNDAKQEIKQQEKSNQTIETKLEEKK